MARQLTFKRYVQEGEGQPPVEFWWRGVLGRPPDLEAGPLLRSAGLEDVPQDELSSGYLVAPWQGHPQTAFVITTSLGFRPGDRYAISVEPAPTLR